MTTRPSRRQFWLGAIAYAAMWATSIGYLVAHAKGWVP